MGKLKVKSGKSERQFLEVERELFLWKNMEIQTERENGKRGRAGVHGYTERVPTDSGRMGHGDTQEPLCARGSCVPWLGFRCRCSGLAF